MEKHITPAPALYLFPVGLSDADPRSVVPSASIALMSSVKDFIVENVRTARRWIRKCDPGFSFDGVTFEELNRHTDPMDLGRMLEPLRQGRPMGLMSEAGCPAVADPGADIVAIAQAEGLRVVPLVGPSSILMSLMGSGFNGQSFCFHGYLPIEEGARLKTLRRLERESQDFDRTQIFIETPYRNNKLLGQMCASLSPDTMLCIACDITAENESIVSLRIADWKKIRADYDKKPAIFLIYRKPMPARSNERRGRR